MDMIERVARAMCMGDPDEPQRQLVLTDLGRMGTAATLTAETAPNWHGYIVKARAAIEAMREPSKEMLEAGAVAIDNATDTAQDSYQSWVVTTGSDYAYPGWTAMIEAALSSSSSEAAALPKPIEKMG